MHNIFSVDVEDWFFYPENKHLIRNKDKSEYIDILYENINSILYLLQIHSTKATFFVLGELADQFPDIVRMIKKDGHEIASHSYQHKHFKSLNKYEIEQEIINSSTAIYKACGVSPKGFRAPYFSIANQNIHVLDILAKNNFKYDSSIYPISFHPDYGIANWSVYPQRLQDGLMEFPMSVVEILGFRLPCSGGAYLRHYPYRIFKYLFKKVNDQGRPFIFYIHPWELRNSQPIENISFIRKYRSFNNINKTFSRISGLLERYHFTSFQNYIQEEVQIR